MAVLTPGADAQGSASAEITSILPGADLTAAAINLVAETHRRRNYDPTAADIVLTLPTPVDGVTFFIKRVTNGGNIVKIVGETIDGIAGDFVLGLERTHVELVANVARDTYDVISENNPAIGQLLRTTTSTSQGLTTGFVQYTDWETAFFSTPQRIEADLAGDEIGLSNLRVGGAGLVGLRAEIDFTFEYTNNATVEMQLVHSVDGVVSGPVAVNCDGSGKPVSLSINRPFAVTAAGDMTVEFKAESAGGTFTVLNSNFVVENF